MSEWLSQYWHLLIILAVVTVAAVIVFFFAARAYSRHQKQFRKQEAEIKHLLALKEKYKTLTKDVILSADSQELLEGTALSYQLILQKKEAIEEEFEKLNDSVKDIYALDVFVQDKTSKEFFSQNGDILKKRIVNAFVRIGMKDFADKLLPVSLMYDSEDETVSYNEKEIDALDFYISENDVLTNIKLMGAEYIKNNYVDFVN